MHQARLSTGRPAGRGGILFAAITVSLVAGAIAGARADTAETGLIPSFADMIARVGPAVVSVAVQTDTDATDVASAAQPAPPQPPGPAAPFGGPSANLGPGSPGEPPLTGGGSAFFVSPDGYLITAGHVIDGAIAIQITTSDGATYPARVVGTDTVTDLAVLKVDATTPFTYAHFADQMPRVGDWVVAIGNPYGFAASATAGIVSAIGRDLGDGTYNSYLQIDAPLNAGNSGGPTFDVHGNVVGINDAIYSPSGGSIGIGFDVPADTARAVLSAIEEGGHVVRAWLGVRLQPSILLPAGAKGVLIASPIAGGPADRAGILMGDIITAINGKAITDLRGLQQSIAGLAPGASIKLDFVRGGKPRSVDITLAEMPAQ